MNIDSFQKTRYRVGALWIFSLILMVPLAFFPLVSELEDHVLDRFFAIRGAQPPPSELLLVGIDEPSFRSCTFHGRGREACMRG